jgi:hypothetical protein
MPVVVRGVTYRGTNCVQFDGAQCRMVLRLVRGLDEGSRVRGVDTMIPGAAGRIAEERVGDGRTLEGIGWVAGTGGTPAEQAADFEAAMAELRALFDPTLDPGTLEVLLADGSTASIQARTMPEEPEWGDDKNPLYREFNVEWEAVDGADWSFEAS